MEENRPKGLLEKAHYILSLLLEKEEDAIILRQIKPDPIMLNRQLTDKADCGNELTTQNKELSIELNLAQARSHALELDYNPIEPNVMRISRFEASSLEELITKIDWDAFLLEWGIDIKDESQKERASELIARANSFLDGWCATQKELDSDAPRPTALYGIFPACATREDEVKVFSYAHKEIEAFQFFRCQYFDENRNAKSLCDYIAPGICDNGIYRPTDYIGFFAATIGNEIEMILRPYQNRGDKESVKMIEILANRLVSSLSVLLQEKIASDFWGYKKYNGGKVGIAVVPGYPCLPDLRHLKKIFNILSVSSRSGIYLHNNMSLKPVASVCGFYFAHPQADYFSLGPISMEQIKDYANRSKTTTEELLKYFSPLAN